MTGCLANYCRCQVQEKRGDDGANENDPGPVLGRKRQYQKLGSVAHLGDEDQGKRDQKNLHRDDFPRNVGAASISVILDTEIISKIPVTKLPYSLDLLAPRNAAAPVGAILHSFSGAGP